METKYSLLPTSLKVEITLKNNNKIICPVIRIPRNDVGKIVYVAIIPTVKKEEHLPLCYFDKNNDLVMFHMPPEKDFAGIRTVRYIGNFFRLDFPITKCIACGAPFIRLYEGICFDCLINTYWQQIDDSIANNDVELWHGFNRETLIRLFRILDKDSNIPQEYYDLS